MCRTWGQRSDMMDRSQHRGHYGLAGTQRMGHGDKARTWCTRRDEGDNAGDTAARQEVMHGECCRGYGSKARMQCWGWCLQRGHSPSASPFLSHLFGVVPGLGVPQESGGAGGQGQTEGEAQRGINRLHEVQAGINLALQLGTRRQWWLGVCDMVRGKMAGTFTCSRVQKM